MLREKERERESYIAASRLRIAAFGATAAADAAAQAAASAAWHKSSGSVSGSFGLVWKWPWIIMNHDPVGEI